MQCTAERSYWSGGVSDVPFAMAPRPDLNQLKARLKQTGRVHVPNALAIGLANAIYDDLASYTDWRLVLNNDAATYELKAAQIAALKPADFEEFARGIEQSARSRFQYVYDFFSVEAGGTDGSLFIKQVLDFLNGDVFLGFLCELTGEQRIRKINMKASRYRAGHFLTQHNDGLIENRLYAYVLNLTPSWRADWGGLLLFHDNDGHVVEGFNPVFNAINIFRVPQWHSVSMVTPSATKARYSLTGWMLSE
jgi:SM-20-related protein